MKIIAHILATAAALAVATWLISGIDMNTDDNVEAAGTFLAVAVIFGLINAVLKPIIKVFGCAFYVLTLGLIAFVVNGLLLMLTSKIAEELKLPFEVTGFWPAFWGAIVVGVVSWLILLVLGEDD
jgi:putative membrane protein